jgi:hypothetical protein
MARYIDVEKVHIPKGFFKDLNVPKLLDWLKSQPTADVVEVKHGKWVYWQPDGTNHLWSCSVCGGAISTPMKFVADHIKYCEHCGAKMDAERKCDE